MKFGFVWLRTSGTRFSLLVVLILFAGVGCASREQPKLQDDITALKTQVWSLQKKLAEVGIAVSRNSNEIEQIKEKRE